MSGQVYCNQSYSAKKLVLIWLYLVKMRVILGRKDVSMNIKCWFVNRKVKVAQSCPTLCSPWNSPGQNTGVGSLSLLQGIFPTQGLIPGLPHCRQILYQLSHKGSPRVLECVAYPFFSASSWPRNRTGVSCIAGRWFFTKWAIREDLVNGGLYLQNSFPE